MRELKPESPTLATQVQPGSKESNTSQLAATTDITDPAPSLTQSSADLKSENPTEVTPSAATTKRQRKPSTPKQTAAKTKRPASTKAKQIASTQVKLAWEAPQGSIVARFQQLEHELRQLKNQADQINQQSVEIQAEMEELRVIAHGVTRPQSPASPSPTIASSGPLMPSFMQSSNRQSSIGDCAATPQTSSDTQSFINASTATLKQEDFPLPVSSSLPTSEPLRAYRPMTRRPARRRRTLRHTLERLKPLLQLPKKPVAIVLDAVLWTLAAAGLRIGLKFVVGSLPLLAIPLNLLIFGPAIAAAYLAIFVPRSSPAILYRLLLVTLGLFVGGKLL